MSMNIKHRYLRDNGGYDTLPLLLLLVITIIFGLVIPFTTNTLFSTDSWPIANLSFKYYRSPWIKIWNDAFFDGYNNRFPTTILFVSSLSIIYGLTPYALSKYSSIILKTILFLLVYIFARINNSVSKAAIISITILFLPNIYFQTITFSKESLTIPYLLLLIYYLLRRNLSSILGLLLIPVTLLSHPITFVLGLVLLPLISIMYGYALRETIFYYVLAIFFINTYWPRHIGLFRINLLLINAMLLTILFLTPLLYKMINSLKRRRSIIIRKITMDVDRYVLIFVIVFTILMIFPGSIVYYEIAKYSYALYEILFFLIPIVTLIIIYSHWFLGEKYLVYMYYFALIILIVFLVSNYSLRTYLYRVLEYVVIGLIISSAHRISLRELLIGLVFSLIMTSLLLYIVLSNMSNYLFYWLYMSSETRVYNFISRHTCKDYVISGSSKISYYFYGFRNIDKYGVLELIIKHESPPWNELLILNINDFMHGYIIDLNKYVLPNTLFIDKNYSLVYSTRTIYVYNWHK
jgi:hypothetical protein